MTDTLKSEPKEENNATTTVFMEELWEINLKGLRIRSNLSILIIGMLTLVSKASIKEQATMKKSS